ncbi:hypothetical protein [Prescottella agglutinans]|uniref:Scaffolding protein n=1 Tax=Prescottella agglutinans TaxID=1644129 RepID=A0ABT6MER9_9NOCA|nr:hypothetical protein [Prescottella agglutinans]MDH6282810.1 hypothetical protein [Prescottella agglutinans]
MADEATTTDVSADVTDPVETPTPAVEPVETVPGEDSGSSVQAADPAPEAPAEKTYSEDYVRKLRKEAADNRVKGTEAAKQAAEDAERALTERLGKALGFIKDDGPVDPAQLLEQAAAEKDAIARERDTSEAQLRAYQVKDALNTAASKHDGDTSILLPFLKGEGLLDKLDPSTDDFAAQVDALVSEAVTNNPKLKKEPVQVAAPRSGGDLSGGNAAPKAGGPKSIDDLRRERREKRERDRV